MEKITYDEYVNHDCHQSEEDGCATCAKWALQKIDEELAIDRLKENFQ